MITIEKDFEYTENYPLERLGDPEKLLFFDIETTGFSGDRDFVYLIGCIYRTGDKWHFIQWLADTVIAEDDLLRAFMSLAEDFDTLVHFNGDTFDLPFLEKRCLHRNVDYTLSVLDSIDIYKCVRPFKNYLGLRSLKLKAIEDFLGVTREDRMSGGELIDIYMAYLGTRSDDARELILLHNEEDIKDMPLLLPILFYGDFFNGRFTFEDLRENDSEVTLRLKGTDGTAIPVPVSGRSDPYSVSAEEDMLTLNVTPFNGELKYFYPDYKNYYYLIYEDMAVHKSVGEYVEKSARRKATRETCYTKKSGTFLPEPKTIWTPEFKKSYSERSGYFEYSPECFNDQDKLDSFAHAVIRTVFSNHPASKDA